MVWERYAGNRKGMILPSGIAAFRVHLVADDREENHESLDGMLPERRDIEEKEAMVEHAMIGQPHTELRPTESEVRR